MRIENLGREGFIEFPKGTGETAKTSFSEVLKDSITKVAELEKEADQQAQNLATMETADVHGTMIAIEKADMSFQLMMQIRNKIISAYEEIMRMQV